MRFYFCSRFLAMTTVPMSVLALSASIGLTRRTGLSGESRGGGEGAVSAACCCEQEEAIKAVPAHRMTAAVIRNKEVDGFFLCIFIFPDPG